MRVILLYSASQLLVESCSYRSYRNKMLYMTLSQMAFIQKVQKSKTRAFLLQNVMLYRVHMLQYRSQACVKSCRATYSLRSTDWKCEAGNSESLEI